VANHDRNLEVNRAGWAKRASDHLYATAYEYVHARWAGMDCLADKLYVNMQQLAAAQYILESMPYCKRDYGY